MITTAPAAVDPCPPLHTAQDGFFDLVHAPWTAVKLLDVAWGLAQLNRYYGQAYRPYSVAEHSLLVCWIARAELGLDAHGQMAALMHDAHEVFCNDLHPTTKQLLGPAWHALEHRYEKAVRTAFGLHTAFGVHAKAIRLADQMALATELRDIKGGQLMGWGEANGVKPCSIDLQACWRERTTWQDWRESFLAKFQELDAERNRLQQTDWPQPGA